MIGTVVRGFVHRRRTSAACCLTSPARPTSRAKRRWSSTTPTPCAGASANTCEHEGRSSSREAEIIGLFVIGLRSRYCSRQGHRGHRSSSAEARSRDGCSFVNAGMVVPSHFVPLASPGMVQLGLRWMWNPESPFYVKPRLSADLLGWGLEVPSRGDAGARRPRGAGAARPAPREPRLLPGMGSALEQRFRSDRARDADAVQHRAWPRGGSQGGRVCTPARHCRRGADAGSDGSARAEPSHGHCRLGVLSRWTAIWRPRG